MNPRNLSYINENAQIADNVVIDPFVHIHGDVVIQEGTWIGSHVTIMDGVRIGRNCKIFPGAVVGAVPQDLKYKGENTFLEIGDNVTIREYCTVNRGTRSLGKTVIKENALLMAYVHVAHDCVIGENCILANNVNLAGHIEIGDYSILGGLTAVHQFVTIGRHVMVGGGSLVRKDIPPFVKAARKPISYAGVNSIGLRRRGFSEEEIHEVQRIYRLMFVEGYNVTQAAEKIFAEFESTPIRNEILDFIQGASRGIMKGFRHLNGHKSK